MKNKTYQPTDFSDSYGKVGNSEAIVQYMDELQNSGVHAAAPDIATYNTVIGEYSIVINKVNKYAPIKSEKMLRNIIHFRNNRNPLIAPDHRSYNNLIIAWLKTKQPNSAEWSYRWLHRMWEEYIETRNDIIRPNSHTYNRVMVDFVQLGHTIKFEHLRL